MQQDVYIFTFKLTCTNYVQLIFRQHKFFFRPSSPLEFPINLLGVGIDIFWNHTLAGWGTSSPKPLHGRGIDNFWNNNFLMSCNNNYSDLEAYKRYKIQSCRPLLGNIVDKKGYRTFSCYYARTSLSNKQDGMYIMKLTWQN